MEVIQKSTEFLAGKGVESPRLQAELLLAHVLDQPRLHLYLNFEYRLSSQQLDAYRALVRRRGGREPLQRLLGSASFCGLEIGVNEHVLIPRPETELLAEEGWGFVQQFGAPAAAPTALDFGTGSGCLAIALAVHCPAVRVVALDVSAEALELAQRNGARHGVAERIRFVRSDGLAALPPDSRFQLILSNPPYIPTAEIPTLQPEVRDYEPRLALDGGADGLDCYRCLATEAGKFLAPEGRLGLELGDGQAGAVRQLFEGQNWVVERILQDYTQRPRILWARKTD